MTVAELIKAIGDLPDETEVLVFWPGKRHHYKAEVTIGRIQDCYFPGVPPDAGPDDPCLILEPGNG